MSESRHSVAVTLSRTSNELHLHGLGPRQTRDKVEQLFARQLPIFHWQTITK